MVTFEEARQIVERAERGSWTDGTYRVQPYGYQSDRFWYVERGYAEADTDPLFLVMDDSVPRVEKATGALSYVDFRDDDFDASTPVGDTPPSADE